MHYPAFLIPAVEGGYAVMFPDVPGALTQGADIEESLRMAESALALSLEACLEEGGELPPASGPDCLVERLAALAREAGVDEARAALIQMIPAPNLDRRPVKVNISLARGALAAIDEKAARLGLTRSGLLEKAALAYRE